MDQKQDEQFAQAWLAQLLTELNSALPADGGKDAIRSCAQVHYRAIHMDDLIAPYRGDLEGFIRFLTETWQWKVEYDPQERVLTADENKPFCVCPVARWGAGKVSDALCYCSEGFAERMFSAVTGQPVKARVVRSIMRGDSSCVYRVALT